MHKKSNTIYDLSQLFYLLPIFQHNFHKILCELHKKAIAFFIYLWYNSTYINEYQYSLKY